MNAPSHHFFLSSPTTWCTTGPTRSLSEAIRLMDNEKLTYNVWYIPHGPETPYAIDFYTPQIEGATLVDTVTYKNGRLQPTAPAVAVPDMEWPTSQDVEDSRY